jgi:hypothetical protein
MKKEAEYKQRMRRGTGMQGLCQIIPTLQLTEEQISARRDKERAECERYREHASNDFNR